MSTVPMYNAKVLN